jgi:hypothetical protein
MGGPFEEHAQRLLERGYAVIPIIPLSKRPGFFRNGQWVGLNDWTKRFNGRASLQAERTTWGRNGAGLGVLAGPASGDLIGVDIDSDDPDIVAALRRVLPPTEVKKTGAKGETRFYRGPGIASGSWRIDDKMIVEILGAGRQTLLPPTLHPDGGCYRWLGPDTLEDLDPRELPVLPIDIAASISAVLEPFGYCASGKTSGSNSDGNDDDDNKDDRPHRQLNEAALADLDAWVPALRLYKCRRWRGRYEAVAVWRPSSSGRDDRARSRNLKIARAGIRDFGAHTGYTPLDLTMAALGCDLEAAFEFLSQRLNWGAAKLAIETAIDSGAMEAVGVADTGNKAAGATTTEKEPVSDPLQPFTYPPGALGDIIDWITSTARRPNRVLALGAAISIIGTLIGRRVAGPTRSATHLYLVTVAPATAGKDHPRRCILPLLESAGAGVHAHLGDITSQSGFNRAMISTPLCIVVVDEIAGFLGRITSPLSSHWERRLSGKLREQWSCSFGAIGTMTAADYHNTHIQCPALSIFGTSTSREFWSTLQGSEIENGFFSRFLVLNSDAQTPDQDPLGDPLKVPASLAARLTELYCWDGSPLTTARLNDPEMRFNPHILPWNDRQAQSRYRELTQWVESELGNDMSKQAYFGRVAEMAVRLATIRAAGRAGARARVDVEDMTWGADVACLALIDMMNRSVNYLPQTLRGEFADKLIQIIRQSGSITRRQLQQRIRSRYRTQEISDMLNQAVEAGLIKRTLTGYTIGDST